MIISAFRRGMKNKASRIFLWIILFSLFAGFGFTRMLQRLIGGGVEEVLSVNKHEIDAPVYAEKVREEERIRARIRSQYGKHADMMMRIRGIEPNARIAALYGLITDELLNQVVQKYHIHLSHDYVEQKLNDPRFLINEFGTLLPQGVISPTGQVNMEALIQFLEEGTQTGHFEQQLINRLKRNFALSLTFGSMYVPDFMLKDAYRAYVLPKKFSLLTFSLDSFLKKEKTKQLSDQEIRSFFDAQNKQNKQYWIPENRSGITWIFKPSEYDIKVENRAIEEYYHRYKYSKYIDSPVRVKVREIVFDKVKEHGLHTLRDQAQEAYTRVTENPESFAKEAEQQGSKNGGLVDFFKRGEKEKAYERVALRLKADGDISDVFPVENGYVILQRVSRQNATFEPLEKVKSDIVKILKNTLFNRAFASDVERLIRTPDEHNERENALQNFIKDKKGVKQIVDLTALKENVIIKKLFSIKTKDGYGFVVRDNVGTLIRLTEIKKAHAPSFETVKKDVEHDLYMDKASIALMKEIKKVEKEVLQTKQFPKIEHAHISTTGWISGENEDDQKKIDELVNNGAPRSFIKLERIGAVVTAVKNDNGVIVRLDDIQKFEKEAYQEQKKKLYKQVYFFQKDLFLGSFVASLYRNATLNINKTLVQVDDQEL